MDNMTDRQKKFLEFIQQFSEHYGYPPSVRDIAKGLGLSSTASVKKMLDRLAEKGALKRNAGTARGIDMPENEMRVPVVGRIRAGQPVLSEEHIEGYIPVKEFFTGSKDGFFLIVEGDSMKDDGIMEGDYALISPTPTVRPGQTGAFRINGEVTLKRFKRDDDGVFLLPANEAYSPIPVTEHDDFDVIGVLVMVVRLVEGGGYDLKPA